MVSLPGSGSEDSQEILFGGDTGKLTTDELVVGALSDILPDSLRPHPAKD